MRIVYRSPGLLKPYRRNPRINDQAIAKVARSICEFGFRQPIVVDEKGVIICGHTRWKAAKKLRLKRIPVHVARGLTPEQVRAYRLADNKTHDASRWDYDLLPAELAGLQDTDVELFATAFGQREIANLLAGHNADLEDLGGPAGANLHKVRCPKCGHVFSAEVIARGKG